MEDEHHHTHHHHAHTSALQKKFLIAAIFTMPLLLHMFIHLEILHEPIVQMLLCLPVFFIGVNVFGKSAFNSLKAGIPNMDVLIFLGSSSAFFYSLLGMFQPHPENYLFFETTATIITLVLLGNLIEEKSVKQTNVDLEKLLHLQTDKAKMLWFNFETNKEEIREVKVSEVMKGHRLQINTGDVVPVDGKIISGNVLLNESMISGESLPVQKKNQ
jgi:P-type Cu+ transporter